MTNRIVFNATASWMWRRRPVGIIRVEREIMKQLHRLLKDRLTVVVLDTRIECFKVLSTDQLAMLLSDEWVLSERPEQLDEMDMSDRPTLEPHSRDRFVSAGSDWSFRIPDIVSRIYGNGRQLIAACYDLIPLIHPEFTPGAEFKEQFGHHYRAVAKTADRVFAISERSRLDLLRFWADAGLAESAPPIEVVPLAGLAGADRLPDLSDSEAAILKRKELRSPFVIYVSTLEPRKNHQLLLEMWRELHAERQEDCPLLLLVGMRGWGSGDLVNQLSRMPAARSGKVIWLEGTSDALLAHLYSACQFAVFPSYYEGWGLAATEALAYGKACVVSNNSSLGEATGGSMPGYHPLDYPGWIGEIRHLLDDDAYREQLASNIPHGMAERSWDVVGQEFCAKMKLV